MNLHDRAHIALDRVRSTLDYRAVPAAEHALALALETMFRTGDSRSFLTSPEVDRYLGGSNGDRVIRRLLDAGALVEITDPASVERFRAVVPDTSAPGNARVVTLPDAAIEVATASECAAIEVGQGVAIEVAEHAGDAAIEVQSNYLSTTYEVVTVIDTEGISPEGYVRAMAPRSVVWHGKHLGSQAARVYGVVTSSPRPVTPTVVCSVLSIGNRGAKDMLRNLGKHRLIVRAPDDSGWVPGPVTPSTHTPADCPECRSKVRTAQAASLPREGVTMNDCPDCLMWNEHGLPCPCQSSIPAPVTPTAPATEVIGWDDHGNPLTALPGTGSVWQPRPGAFGRYVLDLLDGATGKCIRGNVPAHSVPAAAFKAYESFQNSHS